ncbi:hypothetical protein OIDMADRAFT_26197 [Oidiodendron maius Zn]|uniref:Nephrocystin 3-like N-terminal domain-containing protein n=1 Tax=Oidiodendron maius (strain Zn) TaxID=913774 RepID=A0A0C3HME1_OIDMZ|nr:hypothetical protein OIDMADRAFT_26197 [Oidiodendron maius Zn]
MLSRVKAKLSGAGHRKNKVEATKVVITPDSRLPEQSKNATLIDVTEIETSQENTYQPSTAGDRTSLEPFPVVHSQPSQESHLLTGDDNDLRDARSSKGRLHIASNALSKAVEEYMQGNPDSEMVEQLRKIYNFLAKNSTQTTENPSETIRSNLLSLPEYVTSRKKGWVLKVGDCLSKMYPLMSVTLGLAAAGADGVTMMPFKGAANGISLLLQIAMDERSRGEDFMKQLDRINFQSNRIAEIQRFPSIILNDILLEKSMDLMTAILNFLRLSLMYFKHDYFFNLGKTLLLGPQIYTEAKSELATAIAEYDQSLLLQIATSVLSTNLSTTIDQGTHASREFQGWLQPSLFETESQLTRGRQFRAPGTLKWVIDLPEFQDWRLSIGSANSVLWLSGLPGTGKTIVSAYVVDVLQAQYPNAIVLYFFVKAGEMKCSSISNIIRTLAGQLVENDLDSQKHMEKLRSKGLDPTSSLSITQLVNEILHVPLKSISKPVFVIIDGLDEVRSPSSDSDAEIDSFIEILLTLECHLFIASRPISNITNKLKRYPNKTLGLEDNSYDIELFVSSKIEQNPTLRDGFIKLKIDPVSFIVSRSKGNFLWVSIVFDLLSKSKTLSMKSFQSVLDTLPGAVSSLYDSIMTRIEQNGNLPYALALLQWVLYSQTSLNLNDLKSALEIMLDDEILDLNQLVYGEFGEFLVVVPHPTQGFTTQVGHETFRSYITQEATSTYLLDDATAHAKIVLVCLQVLSQPEKWSSSLRNYAVEKWTHHFEQCSLDVGRAQAIDTALAKFLTGSGLEYYLKTAPTLGHRYYAALFRGDLLALYDSIVSWSKPLDVDGTPRHSVNTSVTFAKICLDTLWDTYEFAQWAWRSLLVIWQNLKGENEMDQYAVWRSKSPEVLAECLRMGGFDARKQYHALNAAIVYVEANFDGAEELLWKAYDGDPENFICLQAFGEFYRWGKHKDIEKCLEYFEKAMKLDPHPVPGCSENYWSLLAAQRAEKGKFEAACQAYRDALENECEGHGEVFWNRLADLYQDAKDYQGAKQVYLEALRKHPEDGWKYWSYVAQCDEKIGNWRAQISTNLEAIREDPERKGNYLSSLETIANKQTSKQHYKEACEVLMAILNQTDLAPMRFKEALMEVYLEWGKWKEALELLEELIPNADSDDQPVLWQKTGDSYLALGMYDKAVSAYKQDTREKYCYSSAAWMGRAHRQLKQYGLAIREFKRAIRLSDADTPAGPVWSSASYNKERMAIVWLAETYELVGRHKDAKEQYEVAKMAFKDRVESEEALETAAGGGLWRSGGRTHRTLATILYRLGEIEEARKEMDLAVKLFDITTYVEDDVYENSELEEATRELERMKQDPIPRLEPPTEEEVMFRIRRDLIFRRRQNEAVKGWDSKPPRHRY